MTLHGVSKRPLLLLSFIVLVVQLIAGRYGLCAAANSDADGHSHKQLTNELVPYLKTLRHAMAYFQSQVGRVTLDAVFCLRIALAHFRGIQHSFSQSQSLRPTKLQATVDQLEYDTSQMIEDSLYALQHTHSLSTHEYFNKLGYVVTHNWKPYGMHHTLAMSNSTAVAQRIPTDSRESTSDECMAGMLGTGSGGKACTVSKRCFKAMLTPYGARSTRYTLTHQLLMALLASTNGCREDYEFLLSTIAARNESDRNRPKTIRGLFDVACANVYLEMEDWMAQNKTGKIEDQDIFLEQGSLCSYVGYPGVLPSEWVERTLPWQVSGIGCIDDGRGIATRQGSRRRGNSFLADDSNSRHKRSYASGRKLLYDPEQDDGCSQHATGLLLSYLSAKIRYMIELQLGVHGEDLSVLQPKSEPTPIKSPASSPPSNPLVEDALGKISSAASKVSSSGHALLMKLTRFIEYLQF